MSETTNLKLKKHDNPETNTEKFDIENYLNGNWDKIDDYAKEVNTEISNINSKNTELEKELKEAQEDFYQNSIRGQASGEYIHVEDSSNCRAKIGISGNSEQETREGYNLLNFKKWKDNNVSWNLGKSIVYGDNYVSGTSEGTDCYSNTVNEQYRFNCEPNTTYTLFFINDNSIMCRPIAFVYDSENKNIQTLELGLSADNIIIRRFTTLNEAEKMAIRLGTNVNGVNFKFSNIMILKGSYDKSTIPNYEQYGASPSPDYLSKIKTVGSNVNIFDLESYYNIVPSANCTKQLLKNGIRLNFTAGNDAYIGGVYNIGTTMAENQKAACIKVKPNTTYTLKMSSAPNCYMSFLDKDYKAVKAFVNISSNEYVFSTDSSTEYIYLRLGYQNKTSGLTSYDFTDIKCVEGTEVGEYSPYGQGCINEVICNKNLVVEIQKGYWNNTGVFDSDNNFCSSKQIKVEPGKTYVCSLFDKNKKYVGKLVYTVFDKNKNFIRYSGEDTITIANNEKYVSLRTYTSQSSYVKNNNLLMQLEEGSTVTPYEEHQSQSYTISTQQPFRAIGDTRNTFIKKNNKWYEHHPVIRKIFDGTEDWNLYTSDNARRFGLSITENMPKLITTTSNGIFGKGLCSHFGTQMNYTTTDLILFVQIANLIWYIGITDFNSKWANVTALKEWLSSQYNAGTPVYVDYVLETPLDIECTEEQSKILEELNNARTYKNVTNIYSTDEISPILDLDYAKDLETLLNNTQALAVNNASEGV